MIESMALRELNLQGYSILVRENTSDLKAVQDVLSKEEYKRRYMPVTVGERWLDAGANIGAFSLWVSMLGAVVVGYEAEPNNCEMARLNLKRNNLDVVIHHAALVPDSYESQFVRLWLHPTQYGQWRHTIERRNHSEFVDVPAIRFSTLLGDFDGVKLDIEGAELNILEEIKDWGAVNKLVLEYHFDTDNRVARYNAIVAQLGNQFDEVRASNIKADIKHYTWFPQAKKIFAWNTPLDTI